MPSREGRHCGPGTGRTARHCCRRDACRQQQTVGRRAVTCIVTRRSYGTDVSVVVTGAAGFIGCHVVAALRRAGRPVIRIDRRPGTPLHGETAIVADLADDSELVRRALRDASRVIPLAACAGVRDWHPDTPARRWRNNVIASVRVLQATPLTTPMVVASSSSVYGRAGECDAPRPCRLSAFGSTRCCTAAKCVRTAPGRAGGTLQTSGTWPSKFSASFADFEAVIGRKHCRWGNLSPACCNRRNLSRVCYQRSASKLRLIM